MALEAASFIDGLVVTNPPGTDDKRQGDDHIRLIKNVLKNTFPGATRPFPLPSSSTKTVSVAVAATEQNSFIIVNNTAELTLTMPALASTDAGWQVTVMKLGTVFPVFIAPPSGVIISGQTGVARARRNIPLVPFSVLWTGSNWVADRIERAPMASVIPIFTPSLPIGYEWPNGQTLVATNYPEYAALRGSGTTPDLRQRTIFGTNLGGADTGRITSVISPSLDNSGGNQFMHGHNHGGLTGFQTANHAHTFTTGINNESLDHTHVDNTVLIIAIPQGTINPAGYGASVTTTTTGGASFGHGSHTHSGGTSLENASHQHGITFEGSGASQNMPPAIICNYALVVE